ncbi:MAG: penicillin-binding protein 1C, partial [Deltaproteobacteria bacterium]|nr:penicillin-binding protein 1C [Deltaproteobacteria bacterium]
TGTSFGFKDAWAIGSNPRYTAVVWTGNADTTASADLVGSEAAGPLLFDVLEGLADRARGTLAKAAPAELTSVEVCAYSGHLPTDACEHRVHVQAAIAAVPTAPCPYHQAYDVDRATARAVLPACREPDRTYDRKTFVVLPSSVAAWLTGRNRSVPEAPVFAEGCVAETVASSPPTIVSPAEGQVVTLIAGVPAKHQLVPLTASTRASTVSWFVDGALIGTGSASERQYWTPSPGKHVVVVADDTGRKSRRTLLVEAGVPIRR